MKWIKISIIIIILSCKTYTKKPTEYTTQDYKKDVEYLQNWIFNTMQEYKVVGLSLVVVDDREILWKFQAGYENKEKKIPVKENTNFNIGSITKIINAVAILKLVEEKKLRLDDPIHKYIDDLPIDYDYKQPITIKQLITHHSGLPSDFLKYLWNKDYLELSEITKEIKRIYLSNAPNEVFSYSNLGVTLSGRIIEVITGKKYEDYILEIFRELEMNQTSPNLFRVKNLSLGYNVEIFGNKEIKEPPIVMIPAGGIYSNAQDMAQFMKMLLNGGRFNNKRFLSQDSINQMFRLQETSLFDDQLKIGFPFFLNDLGFGNLKQANHGGDTFAYHSMMILLPELPMGILVMTNTTTGGLIASQIAIETLSFFVKHKFNLVRKRPSNITLENAVYDKKQISGFYNTSMGALQIFDDDSEHLKCYYLEFSCEFVKENHFYRFRLRILKFIPIEIMQDSKFIFKRIKDHMIIYSVNGNSTMPMGSKISFSPLEENHIIGEYIYPIEKNQEPFFYIEKLVIEKKDNKLILKIYYSQNPLPMMFYLTPLKKDKFKIPGLGRQLGDVLEFKNDEVYYSGYVFKRKK